MPLRRARTPSLRTRRKSPLRVNDAGFTRIKGSGRDARATLGPTILKDRPTRTGLHARTEAMLALPTARVRLESSLGHGVLNVGPTPHPRHERFPHREFFGRSGGSVSIAENRVCPYGATGTRFVSANTTSHLTRAKPRWLPWAPAWSPKHHLGGRGTSPATCAEHGATQRTGSTPQLWRNLLNGTNSLVRPTFSTLAVSSTPVAASQDGELHAGPGLWISRAKGDPSRCNLLTVGSRERASRKRWRVSTRSKLL